MIDESGTDRLCSIMSYASEEVDDWDNVDLIAGEVLKKFTCGKLGTYVLNIASVKEKFAVALSSYDVNIYDVNGKFIDNYAHEKEVTSIDFIKNNDFCLLTSSVDGIIRLWDSRCQGVSQTFRDDSDGTLKPLLCFDHQTDGHLLCAGTELHRDDSFLLFWDLRVSDILGGYWNSHTDDITQVHFHKFKKSFMASSSADGLINVFDLNKKTEATALIRTLNVESSINKFHWYDVSKDRDTRGSKFIQTNYVSCVTSIEEYQKWSIEKPYPLFSCSREDLAKENREIKVDYMIDNIDILGHNDYHLATGTNEGDVFFFTYVNNNLLQCGRVLKGHSDIVRCISCNTEDKLMFTGGEDGRVCIWKLYIS